MRRTEIRRVIPASPARVYATILDRTSLSRWKVPDGMHLTVHEYEAREGGRLRVSLTYADAERVGKSGAQTDTYHGRFVRLVPDELIVEEDEFETGDPALAGPMTIAIRLVATPQGTELIATHAPVPPGVALEDNALGWAMALDKLAALVADAAD